MPSGQAAHIGLYARNRPEWQILSEACHTQSMVTISLYDSLGEDSSEYIVKHGYAIIVVVLVAYYTCRQIHTLCCGQEEWSKVLQFASKCPQLKQVIVFDKHVITTMTNGQLSIPVFSLEQVEQFGKTHPVQDVTPSAQDLSSIMYTSGTTGTWYVCNTNIAGVPKGVMITHGNMIAAIAGIVHGFAELPHAGDVFLAYLPLAHILERVAECCVLHNGGRIGYWQGQLPLLMEDIQELKVYIYIFYFIFSPPFYPVCHESLIASTIASTHKLSN